jgi:lipopolysaccharide export LptBFGC system permease protein LptF
VILSAMITLGLMSCHNEIMAMKSGGVGLWSLVHPVLGTVLLIFVALLGLNEFVIPRPTRTPG